MQHMEYTDDAVDKYEHFVANIDTGVDVNPCVASKLLDITSDFNTGYGSIASFQSSILY